MYNSFTPVLQPFFSNLCPPFHHPGYSVFKVCTVYVCVYLATHSCLYYNQLVALLIGFPIRVLSLNSFYELWLGSKSIAAMSMLCGKE